jgi:hypothetical protein
MERMMRQLGRGWLGMTTAAIVGSLVLALLGLLKLSLDTFAPSVGAFLIHPIGVPFIVLVVVGVLVVILLLWVVIATIVASAGEQSDGAIGAWVPFGPVMYRADDSNTDEDAVDPDLEITGPYCLKCQAMLQVNRENMIAGPCPNPACDVVITPSVSSQESERQVQAMVEARWRQLKLAGREPYLATDRVFGKEDRIDANNKELQ